MINDQKHNFENSPLNILNKSHNKKRVSLITGFVWLPINRLAKGIELLIQAIIFASTIRGIDTNRMAGVNLFGRFINPDNFLEKDIVIITQCTEEYIDIYQIFFLV